MPDQYYTGGGKSYIHYNPEHTDYVVNENELSKLGEAGQNTAKDFFLVTLSIGVPCFINALSEFYSIPDIKKPFQITLSLFLNFSVGVVCIILSIFFGLRWNSTKINSKRIIEAIKQKPKLEVIVTSSSALTVASQVGQASDTTQGNSTPSGTT